MPALIEPNIHPILVHFAFALSVTSVICYLVASVPAAARWRDTLRPAADWMLAFGAAAIVATIAAGFQAYYSVGHDGPSHAAMTVHRNWAVPTGTAILALAIWRWTRRNLPPSPVFKALLTVAAISLTVTAWWGGNIVYNYGLGVKSLPEVTGDGHDHDHGSASGDTDPTDHDAADGHHGEASNYEEAKESHKDNEPAGHDNSDGHHTPAPASHDNSDRHHDSETAAIVPSGHDNSDGHHDAAPLSPDDQIIRAIMEDVERGWETGDGAPFREHYLDFAGARYFESGGGNEGLTDLVENHVEPEKTAIPDLSIESTNVQINYEGDVFAWVVADTAVGGTIARTGQVLRQTGKETWLLRKVEGEWKVVHTHSSSRARSD